MFQQLSQLCKGAPMSIIISHDKEVMRVIVSLEGYSPIFVNGSPSEIDEQFMNVVMPALLKSEKEITNMKAFEESIKTKKAEQVKANTKTTTTPGKKVETKKPEPPKPKISSSLFDDPEPVVSTLVKEEIVEPVASDASIQEELEDSNQDPGDNSEFNEDTTDKSTEEIQPED